MKTSNYRMPGFNCNFGNDLPLHTNSRVINSDVLTVAVNAIYSNVGRRQGQAAGVVLRLACNVTAKEVASTMLGCKYQLPCIPPAPHAWRVACT